jgi:hypothetical protein
MYALATTFVHPIYTRVWVSGEGDVIAGDFDNTLFTFSKKSSLGRTCLLSDTIVNLFNSLPEDASLTQMEDSYRIDVKTDGYEYVSQFTPQYEGEDNGVGFYMADEILPMSQPAKDNAFKVAVPGILKSLSQSDLLSSGTEKAIELSLTGNELTIKDNNIDCKTKVEGTCNPFHISFKFNGFKQVLSNIDADTVNISPIFDEEVGHELAVGVVIYSDNMSVVLGGIED